MALEEIGLDVQIRAELDRFDAAMAAAGQDVIKFGTDADRGTKRAYDGFRRLESSLDPSARALQRLEQRMAIVDRGVATGMVTLEREVAARARANTAYDATIAKLNGVAAAQTTGAAASARGETGARNMGNAVQQAGYQVGDFAVQVASGQGVLRPFIQQGTQLVSMFGPWGAVIGAAGAIVGALAQAFLSSGTAADTSSKALVTLEEVTGRLNEKTETGVGLGRDQVTVLLEQAKATNVLSRARMTSLETELAAQEKELARHQNEIGGAQVGAVLSGSNTGLSAATEAVRDNENAIIDLRGKIAQWGGDLDVSAEQIGIFEKRLGSLHSSYDEQIADNQKLAAALKISRHEYDVTKKSLEILADKGFAKTGEALADTEARARVYAEQLVAGDEAIGKLTDRTKGHTKSLEEQKRAYDDYIATIDLKNQQLQNEIDGQTTLNPLLEAEAALTKSMGRDLLPEEIDKLKDKLGVQAQATAEIARQKDEQKEYDKQIAESEKVWQHWRDNVQDAFADTLLSGEDFATKLTDILKRAAAEAVAAWVMGGQASASGFFGAFQSAMGGGSGGASGGGMASPSMMSNVGSMFGGQNGLLSTFQSGANWASNGLGFGSLFGGGAVTATSAAQAAGTVGAHAAPYVAGASGAGAGGSLTGVGSAAGSTGGLTAAASAIPVWGWIMAAAATVKSMVAGAPRDSAKGAVSTLLGPSLEEWQADPRRSLQNALNPIGTTLMDFGAPEWLGGAFNQFDPAGGLLKSLGAPSWLTPLTSLFGEKKPSNYGAGQVTNYGNQSVGPALYDPSEASQTNIDAVQSLTSQLLELNKLLVSATGGISTGVSTINVGSRDGLKAGFGTSFAQSQANTKSFANSAAGAQELLDYMAKSIATNLSGVTDPLYKKALQGGSANDIVEGVQFVQTIKQALDASKPQTMSTALLELDTRYGQLINTSRRLGLATTEVIQLRDQEIAAIQKNVADQRDAFQTNLWERVWTLQGRDDLVFQSQLDTQRKQQLASAKVLLDQQIITQAQFSALSNILDQEVAKSLENFNNGLETATTKLSRADAAEMATNALSNVTSFVRGLATSDLSPLNAQQKVALAQTEFDRVSGLARSGDAGAIGQFNEVSQTLLQLERQVYGSGTAYVDVYNKIIDAANQIGNLDPEQLIAKTIEISTQTQTQTLVEALAEVRDAVLQLRNQQSNKPALAA